MNRTNAIIIGVLSVIALAYAGISFVCTYIETMASGSFALCLFNPIESYQDTFVLTYVDLMTILPDSITDLILKVVNFYGDLIKPYLGDYTYVSLSAIGFAISAIGIVMPPTRDLKGAEDDPREYLFTHRPRAFVRCLLIPLNVLVTAWRFHKIPIILPLLILPLMIPYVLMMDVFYLVGFVLFKLIISLRMKMAINVDKAVYENQVGSAVCPYCKRSFYRPKIKCKCGLIVDYPAPGIYGISYNTCNNGHDLPAENISGARGKLQAICPYCNERIVTHEAKPLTISMVGTSNSGKTSYILGFVEKLTETLKPKAIVVETVSDEISQANQASKASVTPTSPGNVPSSCLFVRGKDFHEKEILFNDISGIEFEPDSNRVIFQEYYRYTDGVLFTIDPQAMIAYHNSQSLTKGSKTTPTTVFETFYNLFTTVNNLGPASRIDVPLAIVVTKSDIPMVSAALDKAGSPEMFIEKYGDGELLKVAKSIFTNVKIFSISSNGKTDKILEPMEWILSIRDKDFEKLFQK